MLRSIGIIGLGFVVGSAPVVAQIKKNTSPVQQVIPAKTVYWMSAATSSGFGVMGGKPPSAGEMMRMAMGGGGGTAKLLSLDLGSKLPPAGLPMANHALPPGMAMGPGLVLRTPRPEPRRTEQGDTSAREDFERPKGRLLLFWGCGETARRGQPVVIDFARLGAGDIPPNLFTGERVRIAEPPSASTWPTWGGWPNDDRPSRQGVPSAASLIGTHKVAGNYTPDINFTLAQDWMSTLDMQQAKLPSGAVQLRWNGVPGATAHFAQMIGGNEGNQTQGGTMVFWSSSETQTFISGLSDYIAPAEAARLVGRKQLLPPTQTNCVIPKDAMAATQGGMISLVAHGPEANFVYPPRPADPKVAWVQEWTVKARFVSRTGSVAGMDTPQGKTNSADAPSGKPKCPAIVDPAAMIGGAIGGALGMFSKKNKKPDCE